MTTTNANDKRVLCKYDEEAVLKMLDTASRCIRDGQSYAGAVWRLADVVGHIGQLAKEEQGCAVMGWDVPTGRGYRVINAGSQE